MLFSTFIIMSTKYIYVFIALFITSFAVAGDVVKGYVYNDLNEPVEGATVVWQATPIGVVTNKDGYFEIEQIEGNKPLTVYFIGYETATVIVEELQEPLRIILMPNILELDEVIVSGRRASTISSRTSLLQTQTITYDELCRAACCNLAESFETNPSVDVSYSDATTGAQQIKLLGLSGIYVQMLTENYPNLHGASSLYGLDYIPGPWMESIQISKGTSSVKNGYEALAGQINVEYKKPATADIFSANVFASDAGRYEGNADASWHINENLTTGFFVNYSKDDMQHDENHDGFLDMPLKEIINLMNRWQYHHESYISQYGLRYLHEDRTGGQATKHHDFTDPYLILIKTNRVEGYTKQAYILDPGKVESVALIFSGSYHDQQSKYDYTPYNVYQHNMYASLLYEKEFVLQHSISVGLSLNYNRFDENLTRNGERYAYNRSEAVPGAYIQYTFNLNDKFILLAGIRADRSSLYDFFVTPRIHLKYNPFDWFHLRASAGKGYRTANILAENNFLLANSRKLNIADNLDQEEAWNTGINFSFYIPIARKELIINAEWYYTNFNKQIVVDMDSDPHEVSFYNLNGKSYSSSFQIEATYPFPFLRGLTMTGAYRFTDAQTDFRNRDGVTRRLKKPLASDYKGLITASYQTPLKKWQVDLTGQFNGGGRMPTPEAAQPMWETTFKAYQVWHVQMTKYFRTWSVYVGSENLFNFTQAHPVIDAANPRGDKFDGTMVWGPVHGRKIYVGARYNLSRH